jgi:protein-S-isoprenylcysteine O-methyltransferase Ste14
MRSKIIFTLFAVAILNIGPLLFKPDLILHFKTIILSVAAAILWLSQPGFSASEMQINKQKDKLSVLIILFCSSLSVFSAVSEWAYATENKSEINIATIIGLIMLVAGITIRVVSINILGKHFTATVNIDEKHELIQKGPYKFVRHPGYSGAFIAIIGCPLFLNNLYTVFVATAAMGIAYYIRINLEEEALSGHFGDAYKAYQKKTHRLLPFIW